MSSGGSVKVVVIAMLGNLGIALAKFAGAFVTGSASLLAEAIHSLVDTANQVLLLVGHKASARPADPEHPMGHGREGFFWSFIVAMLLFSMGGMFAVYEGVHKLHSHEPLNSPAVGLAILLVSIAIEAFSLRACLKEVGVVNRHGSLWTWFRKASAVELLVIFMEDTAALAGLVLATAALLLSWLTGDPRWDAAGSIVVGAVLIVVAVLLAAEIKSLLIGEAPDRDYRAEVEALVRAEMPGAEVLRFIALNTGAQEVMLAYKVTPGALKDIEAFVGASNRVEAAVKARFPEVKWQFVEPDRES